MAELVEPRQEFDTKVKGREELTPSHLLCECFTRRMPETRNEQMCPCGVRPRWVCGLGVWRRCGRARRRKWPASNLGKPVLQNPAQSATFYGSWEH